MHVARCCAALCALGLLLAGCQRATEQEPPAPAAGTASADSDNATATIAAAVQPLFDGLGSLHFPITTRSDEAQRYFDQGLMLGFAFNHAAADLAYTEATRRDPQCALCYWGSALALGPNINAPMDPAVVARAYKLAHRAASLAQGVDPKERKLIDALLRRYASPAPAERAALDEAYAQAMRAVADAYPQDVTLKALAAEALMDVHPWDLWLADGSSRPWTPDILSLLESGLQLDPDHVGAMHLYLHAVEASQHAERAEGIADRIAALAPAAGHLVHMPAHIYIRIGRYHDATLANIAATQADTRFLAECHANGLIYRLGYVPHNYHFGWITAALEGWSAQAIEMAQATAEHIPVDMMRESGLGVLQHYYVMPLYAGVTFARWKELLAFPAPQEDLAYARAIWHYARGRALIGQDELDEAQKELDALRAGLDDTRLTSLTIWDINSAHALVAIAAQVLGGELAAARGELEPAIADLRRAVALEDGLKYNEPPDWFYPSRHSLGAVLLAAGDAAGAQQVYEQDLRIYRENGWALYGLAQSLRAQGDTAAADAVQGRFRKAWAHADFELSSSRL